MAEEADKNEDINQDINQDTETPEKDERPRDERGRFAKKSDTEPDIKPDTDDEPPPPGRTAYDGIVKRNKQAREDEIQRTKEMYYSGELDDSPKAKAAVQAQEEGENPPEEAPEDDSQEIVPPTSPDTPQTPEPETYEITVDGKTRTVTREELITMAQKGESADEKFRLANEKWNQIQGVIDEQKQKEADDKLKEMTANKARIEELEGQLAKLETEYEDALIDGDVEKKSQLAERRRELNHELRMATTVDPSTIAEIASSAVNTALQKREIQSRQDKAISGYRYVEENFSQLLDNGRMQAVLVQEIDRIEKENPGMDPMDIMKSAAENTQGWLDDITGANNQRKKEESLQTRQSRKPKEPTLVPGSPTTNKSTQQISGTVSDKQLNEGPRAKVIQEMKQRQMKQKGLA